MLSFKRGHGGFLVRMNQIHVLLLCVCMCSASSSMIFPGGIYVASGYLTVPCHVSLYIYAVFFLHVYGHTHAHKLYHLTIQQQNNCTMKLHTQAVRFHIAFHQISLHRASTNLAPSLVSQPASHSSPAPQIISSLAPAPFEVCEVWCVCHSHANPQLC